MDTAAAVAALRQELAHEFDATIQNLHTKITALQTEIITLHAQPSHPKPILSDPEKFTSTVYKFNTWLPSIKSKLRVDQAALEDSIAQFYYVYLNLDSKVQAMILPQLSQAEESE